MRDSKIAVFTCFLVCTIALGGFVCSALAQTAARVQVFPNIASVIIGQTQQFRYQVFDKHGNKMNAQVECSGNTVWINGPSLLRGAPVRGHDIRTCASLLLLALAARGETVIDEWRHLRRGYHDLPGKLRSLGARITEASSEKHDGQSQLTRRANR